MKVKIDKIHNAGVVFNTPQGAQRAESFKVSLDAPMTGAVLEFHIHRRESAPLSPAAILDEVEAQALAILQGLREESGKG